MKHTALTFIIALGLVVPGLAYAANPTDNGNAVYKRDLATWNGTDQDIHAPRLVSQRVSVEYDNIYKQDIASSPFQRG